MSSEKRSPWGWMIMAFLGALIIGLQPACTAGGSGLGSPATASSRATPTPSPTPTPVPLTLSGTGSQVEAIHLQIGLFKVSWSAQGQGTFTVIVDDDGEIRDLVNATLPDPSSGETKFRSFGHPNVVLKVMASGASWTITFLHVGN